MRVEISSEAPEGWDNYVDAHPMASAYHRSSAVLIGSQAFGLKTHFLTAWSSEAAIAGVLPIVEQSSLYFGRFLTSLPFVTYGGILAECEAAQASLVSSAAALGERHGAKHVELRHRSSLADAGLVERLDKVSMVLPLPDDEDALSKSLGSKLRSQIRRAERESPTVDWGGGELLGEFYSVFAPCMHGLGTPVYPMKFFEVVIDALGDLASVIVVRVNNKPEAAAIVVRHGGQIEVPWAAASLWAKRSSINMRMYWEMLRSSIERGVEAFDFGRSSPDSGTYRFKAQWGATPQQLRWHYWLPDSSDVPTLNHSNPKYALAIRAWQRMPLWCANLIGPHISRHLP